jgi:hypothetical protein
MLGFDSRELPTPMGKVNDAQQEMENNTENDANSCQSIPPPSRCPCGPIYRGGQGSHYNVLNAHNQLPR